jgi:hypothetical protein
MRHFFRPTNVARIAEDGEDKALQIFNSALADSEHPATQSSRLNLLKPTGYVMHHQFNIQQLYALPTLYLCVLYFFLLLLHAPLLGVILHALLLYLQLQSLGQLH